MKCILCGRLAGHLVGEHFVPDEHARPAARGATWRCGECGGSLYAELDQETMLPEPVRLLAVPRAGESRTALAASEHAMGMGERPRPPEPRVVLVTLDAIAQTPDERNSRMRRDRRGLEELAASIREHGVLQPILIRPITEGPTAKGTPPAGPGSHPKYVVIAGNRRLQAARQAGLRSMPCTIRVTDADRAFILNVVENLQRRELSGRERVRAMVLLAALSDEHGRKLGVREISRRTGLATGTISTWLRIHRRPLLRAALEDERVDIGRAMALASAPDACLARLIARAPSLSQHDLAAEVAAAREAVGISVNGGSSTDERQAEAAYRALLRVQHVPETVRTVLTRLQQRLSELLAG